MMSILKLLNREQFCNIDESIDYTKERLGARSRFGKVVKCTRCGLHGAASLHEFKTGAFWSITHKATKRNLLAHGTHFWSTNAHCSVTADKKETIQ